ncbi:hypothetical protein [Nostocoides australiense]|uniref:Uncharacterized protein n=1 Tax=Nostocoides australiense Ben110 TaxID=1193182 RepID=W6K3L8_9MICO|nr:hypothetical protein [Tetrasphaera australiensis]CCH73489.1 hypothetical protein BN11_2810002 [Tetrasphaera australiensis Ben110]HPF82531.1 hypothetical protein [Tetrasphaera australiensis]
MSNSMIPTWTPLSMTAACAQVGVVVRGRGHVCVSSVDLARSLDQTAYATKTTFATKTTGSPPGVAP